VEKTIFPHFKNVGKLVSKARKYHSFSPVKNGKNPRPFQDDIEIK
jgi:hypothetical protein